MSLPSGYKQLEYIQSSGTQKIDTGLLVEKSDSFEMEFEWTPTAPSSGIYVGADGYMQVGIGTSGYGLFLTSNTRAYGTRDKVRVVFANVTETLYVNNTQVFSHNWSNENLPNVKLGLFSCGAAGNTWRSGSVTAKLYGCTIKKSGVLVRNFIPCKNASGVIGLWDDVNSTFYGNAGSGTFTAGPETIGSNHVLIDAKEYDMNSGTVLVNGMVYHLKKGRGLLNGMGYDIPFAKSLTWYLNATIVNTYFKATVSFTSNERRFSGIQLSPGIDPILVYFIDDKNDIQPYVSGWSQPVYRTITFDEEPTGDLLTWLEANGTRQ